MSGFKIPIPIATTQKTIRFPDEIIERVENAIGEKNCSFSAFVVEATRVALEEIEE